MKIATCGILDIDQVWHLVADGIRKSQEKSFDAIPAGTLHQMCRRGDAFLLIAHDEEKTYGASIWQFSTIDGKPVFQALAFYGDELEKWFGDMRQKVYDMARMNGAKSLVDYARPGMKQIYAKNGIKPAVRAVVYEETIS